MGFCDLDFVFDWMRCTKGMSSYFGRSLHSNWRKICTLLLATHRLARFWCVMEDVVSPIGRIQRHLIKFSTLWCVNIVGTSDFNEQKRD